MSASDEWDISLKLLFKERPEDMIQWLMPGAIYKGRVDTHLPGRKLDADAIHAVEFKGKPALVHAEFQSSDDPNMEQRLWQYNVRATIYHELPVYSFVIYLKKERKPAHSPYTREFPGGLEIHRFHFGVVRLWDIPVEALKQLSLVGLLPLLCLTKGGKRLKVVDEAIVGIQSAGGESSGELLALTYILTSLVFTKETEQNWIKRRFNAMRNILRDTWAYKEIKEEGLEEGRQLGHLLGRQEGLQEGLRKGQQEALHKVLEEQREMLLEIVHGRFPAIELLARDTVDSIVDLGVLQRMLVKLSLASTEEAAKQVLLKATKAKK